MLPARLSLAAYRVVRPLLFRFDAERIHDRTVRALRGAGEQPLGRVILAVAGGVPRAGRSIRVAGLELRNRIGVGAGFDTDGVALRGWAGLGLGFVEVGTVTPVPQRGNPRPRLIRLGADQALINRMGFNNAGAAHLARHVMLARRFLPPGFVVGVSIGRNRSTPDARAVADYLAAFRLVAPVADYVTVNVSSPNTPGLRAMQSRETVTALLRALADEASDLRLERPILLKLSPDLADDDLTALACAARDAGASGLVLANTSVARPATLATGGVAAEEGGLSGKPLLERSLRLVGAARRTLGDGPAIVLSGGVMSGADAAAAIHAGADLVQLWTGLVYRGPGLIGEAVAATAD